MTDDERAKRRDYMRKYRAERPEYQKRERERGQAYRKENLEAVRLRDSQWKKNHYSENRDQILQYQEEYRNNNREVINQKIRSWYRNQLNHTVYLLEIPDCRMYIGSTSWLDKRLAKHRQDSFLHSDRRLYQAIREAGGWDQVKVHVLMKDIPDYELRLRLEQHFIDLVPEELRLNTKDAITIKEA